MHSIETSSRKKHLDIFHMLDIIPRQQNRIFKDRSWIAT